MRKNRLEGRLRQCELDDRSPRWHVALLKGDEITVDAGCGADHPALNSTVAGHQDHHYLRVKRGACCSSSSSDPVSLENASWSKQVVET